MTSRHFCALVALGSALVGLSCGKQGKPLAEGDTAKVNALPRIPDSSATFTRVLVTSGFDAPESAVYDSVQNVWFVSNIAGGATDKDHNGFISRLKADGTLDSLHFIKSGVNGALLDGPKGLVLHGDTIWAADIDVARAFDKRTGRPLATVDFRPLHALMLNAMAVGPDGRIYLTDTAIRMANGQPKHVGPDRVFVIGASHKPAVAVTDSTMDGPNGISWDARRSRFLIVGFMGPAITTWAPGANHVDHLTSGVGQFDGNEVLPDGRALVSSWADSSLYELTDTTLTRVVNGALPTPADLHVEPHTMRVAIPLSSQNEVVFYTVPRKR